MSDARYSVLVFDADHGGHRDRGVELLAKVVSGTALQGRASKHFSRLVGHRGPLLWQTADYALKALLPICMLRAALCRRSVLLCYRNDDLRKNFQWRALVRVCAIVFLRLLPFVAVLRIFPPLSEDEASSDWIFDPEWWDLSEMPITSVDVRVPADGKDSILFIGNVSWLKGLEFFTETAELAARTGEQIGFRLVGNVASASAANSRRLEAAGVEIVTGNPSDAEFVEYIRRASFLWCCYAPEYDQSSGVFGRALQLGVPVIVRRGALLEGYMSRFGRGFAVEYGNAADLLRQAREAVLPAPVPNPSGAMRRLSIQRLRAACGGLPQHIPPL